MGVPRARVRARRLSRGSGRAGQDLVSSAASLASLCDSLARLPMVLTNLRFSRAVKPVQPQAQSSLPLVLASHQRDQAAAAGQSQNLPLELTRTRSSSASTGLFQYQRPLQSVQRRSPSLRSPTSRAPRRTGVSLQRHALSLLALNRAAKWNSARDRRDPHCCTAEPPCLPQRRLRCTTPT